MLQYLCFKNYEEKINLQVVSLPHHDIILGKPWLEKWNPTINWCTHPISFPENIVTIQEGPENPLPVKKLNPEAILPECKTPLTGGYDLTPSEEFTLQPGEQQLINTGLTLAIPEGYYG